MRDYCIGTEFSVLCNYELTNVCMCVHPQCDASAESVGLQLALLLLVNTIQTKLYRQVCGTRSGEMMSLVGI